MEDDLSASLIGKTVVVTGATSGIGYQTAFDFAREGAFLIGVGRNPQRCAEARNNILEQLPKANVYFLTADLASQKQIHSLADQIEALLDEKHFKALDVLVNNAGLYMPKRVFTEDGVETTFAVNHIAPFLLTCLLLPRLVHSKTSRVITVSSHSHYQTRFNPEKAKRPAFYFGFWAYKVSKLSNILFSSELNRLQKNNPPHAFAVDPGLVNTDIGSKGTDGLVSAFWQSRAKLGVSPEVPAQTILYLASEPDLQESKEIYWYECKPKKPGNEAMNQKTARRLWVESCRICGLPIPDNEKRT
ncbi:MAG: Short-chain dehydrogenase/reductase SDR [Chloroflexi bacterium]|nr:MAG: Short-chain dehydrogenase/reductase SDR [Chloroflexota bacterium]MBA4374842.1 short-chain dehydrogenase [Anaerolinea sp.]